MNGPLEPELPMSFFAYKPIWHRNNLLLYVVSVPNGSYVGVDIASSGSKRTKCCLYLYHNLPEG